VTAVPAPTSPLPRLGRAALDRLPAGQRPLVDPRDLAPRVVHLGLGAFHRAHQAVATEEAAAATGEPWGIAGVQPNGTAVAGALREQDGLYSVTDRAPGGATTRVVGSLVEALALRTDAARVRELLADADVGVVTLTITEKGYHRAPGTGLLDVASPPVATDLAATATTGPDGPLGTALGHLAAGLRARFHADGAPITVVPCDNMAANGPALAGVVRGFVEASTWADRDALLTWLHEAVAFPATIVDRIVPATTDADRDLASAALGLRDEVPVLGEPYRQWVLEDAFAAPRPRWEAGGALFVPDVAPYQLMKLRLLNGAHSAMAYLGLAAGLRTVADVLASPWGEDLVRAFGSEVGPTLPDAGPDPAAYVDDLVERFRNPAMQHLLRQIGSDGSLKVGERWFGALRELRAAGRPTPVLETALAAWVSATRPGTDGTPVHGTTDPAAAGLAACWTDASSRGDRAPVVAALLRRVGADDLAADDALVHAVAGRVPAVLAGHVPLS
jgi:fructuronate reductase